MRQRLRGGVVLTLLVALVMPASAAVGVDAGISDEAGTGGHDTTSSDGQPDGDLGDTRRQLDEAARSLSEIEAAVRRTGDEVAMLDERLTAASTELAGVIGELAMAEESLAGARIEERQAASELGEADTALDDSLDEWRHNRDLLQRRAIHTFKHGRGTTQDLLVIGITGAEDWHEIAVTLETAARIAADDKQLVESSVELTRETTQLRADAGAARTRSLAATRAAIDEERRVATLVARHERIVADIDAELTTRERVLAELESDASARAVLVADLERRVAELELSARRVLVPIRVDLDVYGPPPAWADRLPAAGRPYAAAFEAIGARHGLDGRLIAALVWAESSFRPDAVSRAGALGLAQLMPGTARGLGVDPRDPIQNIEGGTRYLRTQLDRFGSVDLALAAYNAGPGRVERAGPGIPNIVETQLYVVRVLDLYERLSR